MTFAAAGGPRMLARRDLAVERRSVALPANRGVMPLRRRAARNVMRVVARGAQQLALALQETCRAAQAISGIHDLELLFTARARRVVEVEDECGHGLAGPI